MLESLQESRFLRTPFCGTRKFSQTSSMKRKFPYSRAIELGSYAHAAYCLLNYVHLSARDFQQVSIHECG